MRSYSVLRPLTAAFGLVLAAALPAQAQQQSPPSDAQATIAEIQQIRQQLATIQMQTMQENPALQEKQAKVQAKVEKAMMEVSPEAAAALDELKKIEKEFQTARQEQDMAKLQSLMQDARQHQKTLQDARDEAMERENVANAVESFRSELFAAMQETNPKTQQLMDRAEELATELRSAQQP